MNRYEFEDKISDYIDNQLSVSERKDFEDFLNSDNEAKELVESVRKTIKLLSSAETVKSSNEFLPNLTSRINSEKKNISKRSKQKTSNHFYERPSHPFIHKHKLTKSTHALRWLNDYLKPKNLKLFLILIETIIK